jgi:hypothetical protein
VQIDRVSVVQVSPSSIATNSASSAPVLPPVSQSSTVGSFGSFWLPGDAEAMRGRGPTSSRQRQSGGNQQGKGGGGTGPEVTNLKQTLHSARGTAKQASAKSNDKAFDSAKQKSANIHRGDSKLLSKLPKPNLHPARLQTQINRGLAKVRPADSLSSKTLVKARSPMQEASPFEKGDRHVHPDNQGDTNDGKRHGAKRAQQKLESDSISNKSTNKVIDRFEFQGIADEKANSVISSSLAQTQSAKISVPENLRPVLPVLTARVAVLSRDGRRVARFALDLPGGSKLSVKVELAGKKVRLSFITSDQELRKSLRSGSGPIADSLAAFGFSCKGCLVASSYHELGDSVSKAA